MAGHMSMVVCQYCIPSPVAQYWLRALSSARGAAPTHPYFLGDTCACLSQPITAARWRSVAPLPGNCTETPELFGHSEGLGCPSGVTGHVVLCDGHGLDSCGADQALQSRWERQLWSALLAQLGDFGLAVAGR